MATLQKLRNMGPLLVIFVGLALLAFIAGDAVKLFDTHSIDTSVGTVGDKDINVMDFQEAYNEFDCLCNVTGLEIPEEALEAAKRRCCTAVGTECSCGSGGIGEKRFRR